MAWHPPVIFRQRNLYIHQAWPARPVPFHSPRRSCRILTLSLWWGGIRSLKKKKKLRAHCSSPKAFHCVDMCGDIHAFTKAGMDGSQPRSTSIWVVQSTIPQEFNTGMKIIFGKLQGDVAEEVPPSKGNWTNALWMTFAKMVLRPLTIWG